MSAAPNIEENNIGPIMKAARKFKKFNQSDVAQAIGCSQSALSKMEHNLLIPNAPQWFMFSRFTSIPPETIETGIIDRHSRVKLNNENVSMGYKLPKRFRLNRAQKVREIYPFLVYLEKKIDGEAFTQFTESVGIDPEFFLDYDNLINFQLIVDFAHLYIRLGLTSPEAIKEIVEYGQNHLYWDHYIMIWRDYRTVKDLLVEYAREQPLFQADFKLTVDYENNNLMLTYTPEPHLYHFLKDLDDNVSSWITTYRKYCVENMIKKVIGLDINLKPVQGRLHSPLESKFEVL